MNTTRIMAVAAELATYVVEKGKPPRRAGEVSATDQIADSISSL